MSYSKNNLKTDGTATFPPLHKKFRIPIRNRFAIKIPTHPPNIPICLIITMGPLILLKPMMSLKFYRFVIVKRRVCVLSIQRPCARKKTAKIKLNADVLLSLPLWDVKISCLSDVFARTSVYDGDDNPFQRRTLFAIKYCIRLPVMGICKVFMCRMFAV